MYMYGYNILYYDQLFNSTFYVRVLMLFLTNITVLLNYCSTNVPFTLHRHENEEVNFSHTFFEQYVMINNVCFLISFKKY